MKKFYVFPQPLNCLFAQFFFAEQIEPFHVYIYVDWHVEYSTVTVANVDAERVVMGTVCCRLATIRTGQGQTISSYRIFNLVVRRKWW